MPRARRFNFDAINLDKDRSTITFLYTIEIEGKKDVRYVDTVSFPEGTPEIWERIPPTVLQALLQTLSIMLGIVYWKTHVPKEINIKGWSLTREQAFFWNELYTKGLGEFFFRAGIDFHGVVSFPFDLEKIAIPPVGLPMNERVLVANGGGKDCIVTSEALREKGIPFHLFVVNETTMQRNVAQTIGQTQIRIQRTWDPVYAKLRREKKIAFGNPTVCTATFLGVFAAVLFGYRYVVFANEHSADYSNVEYLGMQINHQWSKSTEAELLMRKYLAQFVTDDIIPFSMIRDFTEIEMVRRFAVYPRYFNVFSSCNMNFFLPRAFIENQSVHRPYWCKKCPKCAFMFACLAAFLPKQDVINIFGADLYADPQLMPIYEELLGLARFKPFECVGTSEETIVAMHRAETAGFFKGEKAMELFSNTIGQRDVTYGDLEREVFSKKNTSTVPQEFISRFGEVT